MSWEVLSHLTDSQRPWSEADPVLVTLNGSEQVLPDGISVVELVRSLGGAPDGRGVAVAIDGVVLPRSQWQATELASGARLEILVAVGGG